PTAIAERMLQLACPETKSTSSADQKIRAIPETRRHQQTCKQRQIASVRLDAGLSDIRSRNGKEHSAQFRRDHFKPTSVIRAKSVGTHTERSQLTPAASAMAGLVVPPCSCVSPNSWRITSSTGTSCTFMSLTSQASRSCRQVSVTFARGTFSCTETGVCSVISPNADRSRVSSFSKVRLSIL